MTKSENQEPFEEYERQRAYNEFYKSKGKEYLNSFVASALSQNGGEVEAFVPDKTTGKIKDTPSRLTATGALVDQKVSKPTMNAWQSFWSKFGFYKKELAAVNQYEAKMDAWNKVKFNNKVAQTGLASNFMLTNTYLGEIAETRSGTP